MSGAKIKTLNDGSVRLHLIFDDFSGITTEKNYRLDQEILNAAQLWLARISQEDLADGMLIREFDEWLERKGGKLDSGFPAAPAYKETRANGYSVEEFRRNGELERIIEKFPNGKLVDAWHKGGVIHRTGSPARTTTQGRDRTDEWIEEGKHHRIGAPAYNSWSREFSLQKWYVKGILHRKGGPADVYEDWSGQRTEKFCENGRFMGSRIVNQRSRPGDLSPYT